MCRWLAYSGSPILIETLVYRPAHSLIDQSLHARMGVETTNGDGFGIGWYAEDRQIPAVFREIGPAWNNRNLHEIAATVRSARFFAHIRASTGSAVQQTNCHPFRWGRWLWMHNGAITGFREMHRELTLAVDASLFSAVEGSTDSEVMFFLALSLGLEDDPPGAIARMVGMVEDAAHRHGVELPMQMTLAVSDGDALWAFRYSSERKSRSLFHSTDVDTLRQLHPDVEFLQFVSDDARLIVSEPLGSLPGAWQEVPESSYVLVRNGETEIRPFAPAA